VHAAAAGLLLSGRREQELSIDSGAAAGRRSTACSSLDEQCHVVS